MAPDGLYTRRQLAAMGLRPARGTDPAGQLMRRVYRRVQVAYLYPIQETVFRSAPTARQLDALARARQTQQICPACHRDVGYRIPGRYGECIACVERRVA